LFISMLSYGPHIVNQNPNKESSIFFLDDSFYFFSSHKAVGVGAFVAPQLGIARPCPGFFHHGPSLTNRALHYFKMEYRRPCLPLRQRVLTVAVAFVAFALGHHP